MFLKDIGSQPLTKFRIAEIAGAMVVGSFSLVLGIAEVGALFNGHGILFGLGEFFIDSLGLLGFAIPAYLFYAAFLLVKPEYRPDRIFILNCILFPFLTLAIGFVFLRDFNTWAEQFTLLSWVGRGGFIFFILLLTLIEGVLILAFKSLLFSGSYKKGEHPGAAYNEGVLFKYPEDPAEGQMSGSWRFSPAHPLRHSKALSRLFPPPFLKQGSSSGKPLDSVEENHAYGEVFLKESGGEEFDIENLRLPDIKPLASVTAIDKLESLSYIPQRMRGNMENELPGDPEVKGAELIRVVIGDEYAQDADGFLKKEMDNRTGQMSPGTKPLKSSWVSYRIPVKGLLNQYPESQCQTIDHTAKDLALILKETLEKCQIQGEITGIKKGPVITLFEILPSPGVKLSKVVNLQDHIALQLGAASVRILAPIPGKHAVGIEVPNSKGSIVSFAELIEAEAYPGLAKEGKRGEIPVILGKDSTGEARIADLAQMPHLLIAGAAGSGKSVCIHGLILSILYQRSPAECRLLMIDLNIGELQVYNDIPHLLTPVITEPKRAFQTLQYCISEMERRYGCLNALGLRDMGDYNKHIKEQGLEVEPLPYLVVVINEFADPSAAAGKEIESILAHLAARGQPVGIHLVLSTQYLAMDVITGLIKTHIPSRIALMVDNKTDSRIILDMAGAEKLLGKGDMLYTGLEDPFPIRIQGAFVSEEEVEGVVEYLKTLGDPDYIDDELFMEDEEDPLYERAVEIVMQQDKVSARFIQEQLTIEYHRAIRLMEEMEYRGLVRPVGSRSREGT